MKNLFTLIAISIITLTNAQTYASKELHQINYTGEIIHETDRVRRIKLDTVNNQVGMYSRERGKWVEPTPEEMRNIGETYTEGDIKFKYELEWRGSVKGLNALSNKRMRVIQYREVDTFTNRTLTNYYFLTRELK